MAACSWAATSRGPPCAARAGQAGSGRWGGWIPPSPRRLRRRKDTAVRRGRGKQEVRGRLRPGRGRRRAERARSTCARPTARPPSVWARATRWPSRRREVGLATGRTRASGPCCPPGPGMPKRLSLGPIKRTYVGEWLDDRRIAFGGYEPGRPMRGFVQDVESGAVRPGGAGGQWPSQDAWSSPAGGTCWRRGRGVAALPSRWRRSAPAPIPTRRARSPGAATGTACT